MIELYSPNGLRAEVPETENEDNTPRFHVEKDIEGAINYYRENGYVIFSGCVSEEKSNKISGKKINKINFLSVRNYFHFKNI